MPLCPQVTITPITVTSTGMTQTSVIAANAPATTEQINVVDAVALQAQADATAAQAAAEDAYDTAVAANTAASTAQTTADGKNKVTYSTSAPGSTANALGDIWYQYGTTAPNVGRIIAQYSGAGGTSWTQTTVSGLVIANIDAGSITTGTLSVALGITGTSGNFSVNAVTGSLVASSATITGAVNATSGYFGSSTNGYSIGATGLTGVGTGAITGGLIQTSTGASAVVMDGPLNAIGFKNASNFAGWISGIGTAGIVLNYGTTPDVSAYPQVRITSGAATLTGASGSGFSANNNNTNGITGSSRFFDAVRIDGQLDQRNTIVYPGIATGSGSTMVVVTTGSRVAYTTSSERFKQDISYIDSAGWLDKVMQMRPITYKTSEDFTTPGEPNELQIGFLAEDINDIGGGLETAVVLDPLGDPFSLSYDRLTVFLALAVKELKAEIDRLKGEQNGQSS